MHKIELGYCCYYEVITCLNGHLFPLITWYICNQELHSSMLIGYTIEIVSIFCSFYL